MYILGIETTGAFASVALLQDDKIIARISGSDRFSHLQNLIPQIDGVVKDSKLSLDDVDAIAVSRGPGSFTGIRIGVSTARALSQILGIPCVAVSSLEALALRGVEAAGKDMLICPLLDARRNQVYAGGYVLQTKENTESKTVLKEAIPAGPYMLDEFLSKTEGYPQILLLGDGVDTYHEKIDEIRGAGVKIAPKDIRYQEATFVALKGAEIYRQKGGISYDELEPDYMRIAEAERKLKEKQGSTL